MVAVRIENAFYHIATRKTNICETLTTSRIRNGRKYFPRLCAPCVCISHCAVYIRHAILQHKPCALAYWTCVSTDFVLRSWRRVKRGSVMTSPMQNTRPPTVPCRDPKGMRKRPKRAELGHSKRKMFDFRLSSDGCWNSIETDRCRIRRPRHLRNRKSYRW